MEALLSESIPSEISDIPVRCFETRLPRIGGRVKWVCESLGLVDSASNVLSTCVGVVMAKRITVLSGRHAQADHGSHSSTPEPSAIGDQNGGPP